jgi:uncharacterized Zn-binding protein involved in type VI secretion
MPGVARQGDRGVPHCSPYTISNGSPDVNVNGKPAAFKGSKSSAHLIPFKRKCRPHTATVSKGSSSVFVNGKPIARVGDSLAGCTSIAQGSSDVFAG